MNIAFLVVYIWLPGQLNEPEIIRTLLFRESSHQILQLHSVEMVYNSYIRRCSIIIFSPARCKQLVALTCYSVVSFGTAL